MFRAKNASKRARKSTQAPLEQESPAMPVATQRPVELVVSPDRSLSPCQPTPPIIIEIRKLAALPEGVTEQQAEQQAEQQDSFGCVESPPSFGRRALSALGRAWSLVSTVLFFVFVAAVVLIVASQIVMPSVITEASMENTLQKNEVVFVAKKAYKKTLPQQGDIVLYQTSLFGSYGSEKPLVGRIIGVPGDKISIKGGSVYLNGEQLVEPYLKDGTTSGTLAEFYVNQDTYFILGDNRFDSKDSRSDEVGLISKYQIQGKAVARIFPINKLALF